MQGPFTSVRHFLAGSEAIPRQAAGEHLLTVPNLARPVACMHLMHHLLQHHRCDLAIPLQNLKLNDLTAFAET